MTANPIRVRVFVAGYLLLAAALLVAFAPDPAPLCRDLPRPALSHECWR